MPRVAKRPQYTEFNQRFNCYGQYQGHEGSLKDWRDVSRSLMLELGAGTASISLAFCVENEGWQVLAVDRKSDRLNKAARFLDQKRQGSLVFLQTDIKSLTDYLPLEAEVNLLWLAFPDPYPTSRQAKHRLTHEAYLTLYQSWLAPGAVVRFKTDDLNLFEYTRKTFTASPGLSIINEIINLPLTADQPLDVVTPTRYESRFREDNKTIYYLEARQE